MRITRVSIPFKGKPKRAVFLFCVNLRISVGYRNAPHNELVRARAPTTMLAIGLRIEGSAQHVAIAAALEEERLGTVRHREL